MWHKNNVEGNAHVESSANNKSNRNCPFAGTGWCQQLPPVLVVISGLRAPSAGELKSRTTDFE